MKLFGANWQTTLWGGIFAISSVVAVTPELVAFLPESIEGWVIGVSKLIMAASGIRFATVAKSWNSTGGTVQQTETGDVAPPAAQRSSEAVSATKLATPVEERKP